MFVTAALAEDRARFLAEALKRTLVSRQWTRRLQGYRTTFEEGCYIVGGR
jgi:hypothetical protein